MGRRAKAFCPICYTLLYFTILCYILMAGV